ncbi:MAG TPA: hypothetical protein VHY84_10915 [Bryobacteraceae bacterium]|jgi:hypothetical protein|nr:hypothetical protein [Bryobacteraceae bacterium]
MYGNSHAAKASLLSFYPARASQLMQHLVTRNQSEHLIADWREQQMVKFIFSLTYNVDELLHGFNQKRIWKLAWAGRNLLELAIWVEYCNFSPANAKQFRDDSSRDLLGTGRSIQKQVELSVGKPNAERHKAMNELVKMVDDQFGVSDLGDDYTKVVEAATSLGRKNDFAHANKLLSKYAHPTAISLNSSLPSSAEFDAGFRDMFLSEGAEYATRAITLLKDEIVRIYPPEDV